MSVPIINGRPPGLPTRLFLHENDGGKNLNFDVTSNGQRFLFREVVAPTEFNVAINWFDRSKNRVRTGK